ncbi:hypothetical protein D3C86_1478780 [compost metagenome]
MLHADRNSWSFKLYDHEVFYPLDFVVRSILRTSKKTHASVITDNKIWTVQAATGICTEDFSDHLRHTAVGSELNALELRAKHPQAALNQRLKLPHFVRVFVSQLLMQLRNQLETILNFVERNFRRCDTPISKNGVEFIQLIRPESAELIDQPITGIRNF